MGVVTWGDLVIKSLAYYRNAGLDVAAESNAEIWLCRKSNSTALKDIARSIKSPDPVAQESLVKSHLKKRWREGALKVTKQRLVDITEFVDFLTNSGYPSYEWVLTSALKFFDRRRTMVLEERRAKVLRSPTDDGSRGTSRKTG